MAVETRRGSRETIQQLSGLSGPLAAALSVWNTIMPLILVGVAWQVVASSSLNRSQQLFPPLSQVLSSMWRLTLTGVVPQHTAWTLWRLVFGFVIAAAVGVPMGLAMARSRTFERLLLPIVSVLMPIPALAWIPLFILWFGLGNTPTILLVAFASFLPVVFNTWTGAKTINEVWIRAGRSMGARGSTLFFRVVVPGSLPFILTGMRIGLARAWRAVVAGEMISATTWGLGWMIFDARDFVRTDVMFAGIILIGIIGLLLEKLAFQAVERATVVRWGMLHEA
jgi:NitT/TauT family transport system permease protein